MVDVLSITQFTAAAWMLGLAAWLFIANPRGPACRAFSLFLVLRAVQIIAVRLAGTADAVGMAGVWFAFSRYLLIAQLPVLIYFVYAYLGGRRRPSIVAGAAVATLAAEALYMADHCLDACPAAGDYGPLTLITAAVPLGLAAAAWALDGLRRAEDVRGPPAALVAMALGLNALLEGSIAAWTLLDRGVMGFADNFAAPLWPLVGISMQVAGGAAAAAWIVARTWTRPPVARMATVGLAVGVLATAAFVVLGNAGGWAVFFVGVWRIILPGFATYALLRHRMFAIDARVRWTLSRGGVAGLLVLVYFVISEGSEALVSERFGTLAGILTAATMLLALRPLERWTSRFADSLLPDPQRGPRTERIGIYAAQVALIWADGQVTAKERQILDQLREHLQIGPGEADRIEGAAAAPWTQYRQDDIQPA